jgi:beta-lactamase family protein
VNGRGRRVVALLRAAPLPLAAAVCLACAAALGSASAPADELRAAPAEHPWAERVAAAKRFAAHRQGDVAFAVVDEQGRLRGVQVGRQFDSASVVKVMLLLAYLRQADVRDRPLTDADRHLLAPMIKRSANGPASVIYEQVGAGALSELARDAGMKRFSTNPDWGQTQITARDQAQFMYRLERLIPDRHRTYALGLLASIVSRQRWGIPPAVPDGWEVHFKGGWVPDDAGEWKINQVALLRRGDRRLALAVLTHGNPSAGYGHATVRGIVHRLLNGYG